MSHLNIDYVPLSFINDQEEIKKQIRNTIILIYLFEKYNNPARLEQLIEGTQYGFNASALQSGKNKFLRISDIHESKVNWETVPFCNCDDEKKYLLKKDDILIARTGGTTGKSFKIDKPPANSIYAGYLIRIRAKQEVSPDYIYLFLQSFAYWSQIVNLNERNFRPKANAENLKSLILPDCPSDIQNDAVKISNGESVKGYEELHFEIEKALNKYEKAQEVQKLLSDQLTQLDNLNQAILQEALQGKLVKQEIEDEPAIEVLNRIKAEKGKSGKKEKPFPPIKPEEIPFEIPENWVWCRLGEIGESTIGLIFKPSQVGKFGIPVLRANNVQNGKIDNADLILVNTEVREKQIANIGDILLCVRSGSNQLIGKAAMIEKEGMSFGAFMSLYRSGFNSYILNFMYCEIFKKQINDKKSTGINQLTQGTLNNIMIPLPPLSEQKRIVEEIEKQTAKTKQLKEHIIANQQATEQLLKALLHQAFEMDNMEEV